MKSPYRGQSCSNLGNVRKLPIAKTLSIALHQRQTNKNKQIDKLDLAIQFFHIKDKNVADSLHPTHSQ